MAAALVIKDWLALCQILQQPACRGDAKCSVESVAGCYRLLGLSLLG